MRRWARRSLTPLAPQASRDSELRTSSSPGSNATQKQTSKGRPPFCENPGTSLPGVIMQRRLSFTVDISSFLWVSEPPCPPICMTWEPVSNADSLAPPRPTEETLRVEPEVSALPSPPGHADMHSGFKISAPERPSWRKEVHLRGCTNVLYSLLI